jgi:hypothetical protein
MLGDRLAQCRQIVLAAKQSAEQTHNAYLRKKAPQQQRRVM